MSEDFSLHDPFVEIVSRKRNEILDNYVVSVYDQGGKFLQEDRLILLVRAGSLLDSILDNLPRNRMDRLAQYFAAHSHQLLASGYNIDRINIMYNLFEASVLTILEKNVKEYPALSTSSRSVRNAMQIARMTAVNVHLSQVNKSNNSKLPPSARSNNPSSAPRENAEAYLPPSSPIAQSHKTDSLEVAKPIRKPEARNVGATYNTETKSKNSLEGKVGYLRWPLELIPSTTPPEYKAFLSDGTFVQVLLVDKLESYAPPSQSTSNTAPCRIRQIGPICLAYPI